MARYTIHYLLDAEPSNQVQIIGGPDNLTFDEVADLFGAIGERAVKISHLPALAMRVIGMVGAPFNPIAGRMMALGVHMAEEETPLEFRETGQLDLPIELLSLRAIAERRRLAAALSIR